MTIAEAQYFKDYIDSKLDEIFNKLSQVEVDTLKARTFADRHMVGITGQQMLPQEVFRTFLSEVDWAAVKRLCDGFEEAIGENAHNINENKTAIAANTSNISELRYMLENDYYNDEMIGAMLDNKADAETVETLQTSITSVESKVATNTTNITDNANGISNLWTSVTNNKNSICTLDTIQNELIEKVNSITTNYKMFVVLESLSGGGGKCLKLDTDFSDLVYKAIDEYQDMAETDDTAEDNDAISMLRTLSSKYIVPTLQNSNFQEKRSGARHFLHFKPWQIWFYDKIDTLEESMIEGVTNATLLICFQQDTIDYLVNLGFSQTPIGLRLNAEERKWEYVDDNLDVIDYYDL